MHSMVVLLATGLFSFVACQQHLETYGHFSSPGEAPLLSVRSPVSSPKILASSAFDPPSANDVYYAPEFRDFHFLVPTNFINIDRRFTYPPGFYYESTLYMNESPKPFHALAMPSSYHRHISNNYSPQVYEPGGGSHSPHPSDFQPRSNPELINRGKENVPQLYPRGGPYTAPFQDHQLFPQVYEPPPIVSTYRPNQFSTIQPIPSTSTNIIRDDEMSTRGTIIQKNNQHHSFYHTPRLYNPPNASELPQRAVTTVLPPVNSIGPTPPPSFIPVSSNFVPSLFDTHSNPPMGTPPIFVPLDSPNIIKGEPTPSTTPYPSSNPGYEVSEPQVSTNSPYSDGYGQPINNFTPSSSPEPSTRFPEVILEGLFTPSSVQTVPPRDSPNFLSRQPHVVFEAPGYDNPK